MLFYLQACNNVLSKKGSMLDYSEDTFLDIPGMTDYSAGGKTAKNVRMMSAYRDATVELNLAVEERGR